MADESTQDPLAGLSDHDKAMIAKVDERSSAVAVSAGIKAPAAEPVKPAEAAAPAKAERPADVPEKYWDAEKGAIRVDALLKSNLELERKLSTPKADEKPTEKPTEKPAEAATTAEPEQPGVGNEALQEEVTKAAEEAAKAAGADTSKVNFTELSNEFAVNGELSADSYAKLEAAGMGKEMVDQFIEGRRAVAQVQLTEAYSVVGGKEEYAKMAAWAATNVDAESLSAFDRAVISDSATRKQAIEAMAARYKAAMGSDPTLVSGGPGSSGVVAYQSRSEVTADMRDPRYTRDPAFRAKVEQRLAVSSVF